MIRSLFNRHSGRLFGAAMVALIAGCGGDKQSSSRPMGEARPLDLEAAAAGGSRTAAGPANADQSGPLTPEQIAAQFERDQQAFLAMRRQREGQVDGAAGTTTGALPAAPQTPPVSSGSSRVVFNDQAGGSSGQSSTGSTVASPSGMASPTGAPPGASGGSAWNPNNPFGRPSGSGDTVAPGAVEEINAGGGSVEERLRTAMVSLRRELSQHASYDESPLRHYLVMAALSLVDPEREINPEALYDLDGQERDLLRAYQAFFRKLGTELKGSRSDAALVALLDELKMAITDKGPLKIARAELCTSVEGFGRFETFDKYAFLAGVAQPVVIYTEIEEFTSVQNQKGEWVTDLWQELVIYNTHDNLPIWHQEWRAAPDVSSRKRTDFFISYVVTLPERLTVGQYTLKVRVRDEKSGLIAESGIPFSIVADPKLAAKVPR